jgi:hypothetical protein
MMLMVYNEPTASDKKPFLGSTAKPSRPKSRASTTMSKPFSRRANRVGGGQMSDSAWRLVIDEVVGLLRLFRVVRDTKALRLLE